MTMLPLFNELPEEKKVAIEADKRAFIVFYTDENNERVYIWWKKKPTKYNDVMFSLLYPEGKNNGWGNKKPTLFDTKLKAQNAIKKIYKNFPDEFKNITLIIGIAPEITNAKL